MTKKGLCLGLWSQIVQDTKVFAHQVFDKFTTHNTLSLNVRSTSCTSLATTNSTYAAASASNSNNELALLQPYESLWEVQLELGEIPGLIEGNILEVCEGDSKSIDTAAAVAVVASVSPSSVFLPPLLPPAQQSHTSLLSITSTSTQPQPRRTFIAFEEFPRYPSTFDDSDNKNDYDSEDDEGGVEDVDTIESFIFQPFPQQPPQPHPLLRVYGTSHYSSNNSTTSSLNLPLTTPEYDNYIVHSNNTGFMYSIEPHPLQHLQYDIEEEEEEALIFSRRQFRGNNDTTSNDSAFSVSAPTPITSTCINTDNSSGNSPILTNDLRSDRKDSGVFIHDEQQGTIVQVSPRLTFFSCSESESGSELEHGSDIYESQYRSSNIYHPSEYTELRSRWMNGVTCIPNTNSSNISSWGGGARDRRNSKTSLQRREYIASTSFSSCPTTTSTSTTSTFPSLLAAVSYISLQA
ncbi:hypothetical protein BGZ96_002856 [Linnemannia gamsii]|uniref:Uncharacterized protein n=1 Tax=Linnemannia gamsii TaxID=64522 RepID=A0ABQ7JK08_9FUNG|nr:hypothetical protein BGZ96_002856 [Linnemannia gamsii]